LLSIIIPLYNESETLAHALDQTFSFLRTHFGENFEIILIDDASLDGTFEELGRLIQSYSPHLCHVIHNLKNKGKGHSIAQGVKEAKGDWIFFMDSDLSTPLRFILPFIDQLKKGADIVIASRFEKSSKITTPRSLTLSFLSWAERMLIRLIANLWYSDTQCGFKAFRGDVAKKLFAQSRIERFCFDVEILFLAKRLKLKIETYPVEWLHGKNSKVRLIDPVIFVRDLLRIRWYAWRGFYQ